MAISSSTENKQFSSALLLSIYDIHTIYFLQKENIIFFSQRVFSNIYVHLCTTTYLLSKAFLFVLQPSKLLQEIQGDIFTQKQKFNFFPTIKGFFTSKTFPNLAHPSKVLIEKQSVNFLEIFNQKQKFDFFPSNSGFFLQNYSIFSLPDKSELNI